ncbi:MAG: filamentous hemagglutinin N-terminal domain-containing protein, partial [Rhodospirillales bacterium]|nr:filamentous hemagglutinin N-terminal domain-containing protein [Rhodospirillales bacterium]
MKGRPQRIQIRCLRKGAVALAAVAWAMSGPVALGNPKDPNVASGGVTFSETENRLDIYQSTAKAIIDWRSFSIGAGEITQFHQPSSSSLTLNRVLGPDPSHIFGSLIANGQIMLINPNGILFGLGSRVDVAGLVATTANIRNEDFLQDLYKFELPSGLSGASVVNEGEISIADAGYAALVAPSVRNSGVISANLGKVTLGGAETFALDFYGDNLVSFQVGVSETPPNSNGGQDGNAVPALVQHDGEIRADGGRVVLAAKNIGAVVQSAVNMDGVIRANTLERINGEIVIGVEGAGDAIVTGSILARGDGAGETGGTVDITADRVGLLGHALIDVSGVAGGGTVRVGGDYKGEGELRTAQATVMADTAAIRADALIRGDGGRVILWADGTTRFYGAVSATGGSEGGNGGFVETSGKEFLEAYGSVDASAENGAAGQWLLDPRNVEITGATANGAFDSGSPNVFTPTADTATIDVAAINTSLNGGTSVTVNTGATGAQAGDITVTSAVSKTAGGNATLTLTAAGALTVNNTISSTTGALNVTATAGGAVNVNSALTSNGGTVTLSGTGVTFAAAGDITSAGGNILVTATTGNLAMNAGTTFDSGSGRIEVESTLGSITTGVLTSTSTATTSFAEAIRLESFTGLFFQSAITANGNIVFHPLKTAFAPTVTAAAGLSQVTAGNMFYFGRTDGTSAYVLQAQTFNSPITFLNGADITVSGTLTNATASATTAINAGTGKVNFTGGGTRISNNGGAINILSRLDLDGSAYTLTSGNGSVSLASVVDSSGTGSTLTVNAGTGGVSTSGSYNMGGTAQGTLTVTGSSINTGTGLTAGTVTLNGNASGSGLNVGALTITGVGANMYGFVNGENGQNAAIATTMPDADTHLINDCWISGCLPPPSATVAAIDSVSSPSTTSTSTSTTTTTTTT